MRYIRKARSCVFWSLLLVILLFILYTEVIQTNRHAGSMRDKYSIGMNNKTLSKIFTGVNNLSLPLNRQTNELVNLTSKSIPSTDVAEEMVKRRQYLTEACRALSLDKAKPILPRALVSVEKNILYCPVEKAASTFFRRLLFQLEYFDQIRSPFKIPVQLIYQCPTMFTKLEHLANNYKLRSKAIRKGKPSDSEIIRKFLNDSFHFMFVRDPFTRLFSVYVDKLLSPNPVFWEKWGTLAVKRFRKKPSALSLQCGHDVTFSEFLKLILHQDPALLDPHLRPMTYLCRPCHTRYDVIGSMSTFDRDVAHLASLLNLTESQLALKEMAADEARDAVEDAVVEPFTSWAPRIARCVSRRHAAGLIWKKLQLRGIISSRFDYSKHATNASIDKMEASEYIDILMKALEQSKNPQELSKQKEEAFRDAYKGVNRGILNKIRKLYSHDLKLFGFKDVTHNLKNSFK